MKRFLLLVLMMLSMASAARAEEDVIEPVKKGQLVPFDGQLFDAATAIRWGLWLKENREQLKVELTRAQGICEAEIQHRDRLLKVEVEKQAKIEGNLEKSLLQSEQTRAQLQHDLDNPPWYKTFWFGFGVGAISASAVLIVSTRAF